jgi:hypothetical protein
MHSIRGNALKRRTLGVLVSRAEAKGALGRAEDGSPKRNGTWKWNLEDRIMAPGVILNLTWKSEGKSLSNNVEKWGNV